MAARLLYNGLRVSLGATLSNSATAVTFSSALTHSGGTNVPTLSGGDFIPLAITDPATGNLSEIVYLTAYTAGATFGTITRGQEGTSGVAHSAGSLIACLPLVADVAGGAWTALTLAAGTSFGSGFQSPRYRKIANNVHLQGLIATGAGIASGTVLATLPAGFRPPASLEFAAAGAANFYRIDVLSNGQVVLSTTGPAGSAVSISVPPFSVD